MINPVINFWLIGLLAMESAARYLGPAAEVPILVVVKAICGSIECLKYLGELLGP